MNRLVLVLIALGALVAGFVAAMVLFFSRAQERGGALEATGGSTSTPLVADARTEAELDDLRLSVSSLTRRVNELTDKLAGLEGSALRTPVELEPQSAEQVELAASFSKEQREAVRAVIEEERAAREREQQEAQAERERSASERRAERIAAELNLSPSDTTKLSAILVQETDKRRALFEGVRDAGFDRESMRSNIEELRTWRKDELTRTFGASLADQIIEASGDERSLRGFIGGGDGGPGGGFGGSRRGEGGGGGGGGNGGGGG